MMIQTCRICAALRSDPAGFVRRLAAGSPHLTHPSVGIGVSSAVLVITALARGKVLVPRVGVAAIVDRAN